MNIIFLIAALAASIVSYYNWRNNHKLFAMVGTFMCLSIAKNLSMDIFSIEKIDRPLVVLLIVAIVVFGGEIAVWTVKKIKTKNVEQIAE